MKQHIDLRLRNDRAAREVRGELNPSAVVYYIERDGLIKIGTTSLLEKRLRRFPGAVLLATERGWTAREAQLHERFAHLRVTGEWHRDEPELRDYISTLEAS